MRLRKLEQHSFKVNAFCAIIVLGILKATAAVSISNSSARKLQQNNGMASDEIYDLNTNVTLYQKRILRLEVSWKDKLPNDTIYNIFVNALNQTQCPDPPCEVYGISKSNINGKLLLPLNPEIIVDVPECNYMLGCSYHLTVEASNDKVKKSKSQHFEIPYCIMDVCSCQHARSLPKVQINADIPTNDTINFNWSLKWSDNDGNDDGGGDVSTRKPTRKQIQDKLDALKIYKIYLRIGEPTNPSLSWGGKLIPIAESVYSLKDMSYISTNGTLRGRIKIKTQREMTPKAFLNLQTYIEDDLHCSGPENVIKLKVPAFNQPFAEMVEDDIYVHSAWIIGTIVFVCFMVLCLLICAWQRKKRKQAEAELKQNESYLTPFTAGIEMEDNVNYVDKYIEEAQAKGLADCFEVPHYSVQLDVEIGEGAFGRVYKGVAINLRRMRGATVVAVKQLKRNPSADEVSEFLAEIEMLKGVGTHNNIVCFLGCCTIRAPYLMIMEYVGRGDLLTYLRTVRQYAAKPRNANYLSTKAIVGGTKLAPVKYIELKISTQSAQSYDSDAETQRQPKPSLAETAYTIIDDEHEFEYILDNKELHNFALQIANGMRFLEEQEITHRDLAARNVLIDERKTLKISDFGLSRHGVYTNTKTRKLPLRWLSIEAIRDNVYSNKSDVWAYGVVLWEIGTLGASPYPTISNHELIPFLVDGKRLDKPEICTQQVYDIMLTCWHEDPDERPTFEELFKTLSPKTSYVDINSLSDDYVFPPIKASDDITSTGS